MRKFSNILWGLVFVSIGVIIGLNKMNITNIDIFFNGWWTLFIIIPCFIDLFKDNNKTGDIIGLLIGIVLLLSAQNILDFNIIGKLIFPAILVIIGVSIILRDSINSGVKKEINKLNKNSKDKSEYTATFSEQKLDFDEEFEGCDMSAVFGSIECDLRNSKITKDVVINTSSVFAGIKIYVPENVKLKVKSNSIFGGIDNKTRKNNDAKITIYINATCIFGGVELR